MKSGLQSAGFKNAKYQPGEGVEIAPAAEWMQPVKASAEEVMKADAKKSEA